MSSSRFDRYDTTMHLDAITMSDLESLVPELGDSAITNVPIAAFLQRATGENAWVCFEADVRAAAGTGLERLRGQGSERCVDLARLFQFEEQTRCQAFQATLMGEVAPAMYQATVRSILEKLLRRLETWASEPSLYQAAAQCLSEYMSALNHHCNICALPQASPAGRSLPVIPEGRATSRDESGMDSSEDASEFVSEDGETLSVNSESLSADGAAASIRLLSTDSSGAPVFTLGAPPSRSGSDPELDRKERRRESNKKASIKYRARKTMSMQQVLQENSQLRTQLNALATQNSVLSAENQLLKQQMTFLQSMLQNGVGGAGIPSEGTAAVSTPAQPPAPAPAPAPSPYRNCATSGCGAPATSGPPAPPPPRPPPTRPPPTRPPPTRQPPWNPGGGGAAASAPVSYIPPPYSSPKLHAAMNREQPFLPMHGSSDRHESSASSASFVSYGHVKPPEIGASSSGECDADFGVSEWLTADSHLRI